MPILHGRLERLIKFPATYTLSLRENLGSAVVVTIGVSGDKFYWGSTDGQGTFVSVIKTKLEAASPNTRTYTVSVADGETAPTGRLTISVNTGTFAISGISSPLQTLLGNVLNEWTTLAASQTGAYHVEGMWIPRNAKVTPFGDSDNGWYESDARATESTAGHVKALYGTKKQVISLSWPHNSRATTRARGEATASTSNESFETFWIDNILAEQPWAQGPGGPIRLVWDADVDGTFLTFKVTGDLLRSFNPVQVEQGWIELWGIDMPRCVKVP